MVIVANSNLLRRFKQIDIFKLDLGTNLKGAVNMKPGKGEEKKLKIRDEFIKKYNNLNGRYINKFGYIGYLVFYEDLYLPKDEIHVYKDKDIIEVKFTSEDYNKEPRTYLSELLETIDGKKIEKETIIEEKNIVYTNMPQDIIKPNMSMPKEQYIETLVKNRQQAWKKVNE